MDDWSFARPLPPGAFPDEDHGAGMRDASGKGDRGAGEPARPVEPLPAE